MQREKFTMEDEYAMKLFSWLVVGSLVWNTLAFAIPVQGMTTPAPLVERGDKPAPVALPAKFVDVEASWAKKTLERWLEKRWLTGYADGRVQPDRAVTRAEFVTMINRTWLEGAAVPMNEAVPTFADVRQGSWYEDALHRVVRAGAVRGYPDGTFRPDAPLTRQEAATIAVQLEGQLDKGTEGGSHFVDYPKFEAWAKPFVSSAIKQQLMNGYPDGTFQPLGRVTRAETVVMLERLLSKKPPAPKQSESTEKQKAAFRDVFGVRGVVTQAGQPVADAIVRVYAQNGYVVQKEVRTQADGRYEVPLTKGVYDLTVSKNEYIGFVSDVSVQTAVASTETNVILQRGVEIRGTVTSDASNVIEKRKVLLTTNPTFETITSTESGSFRLFVLPNRAYTVRVQQAESSTVFQEINIPPVWVGMDAVVMEPIRLQPNASNTLVNIGGSGTVSERDNRPTSPPLIQVNHLVDKTLVISTEKTSFSGSITSSAGISKAEYAIKSWDGEIKSGTIANPQNFKTEDIAFKIGANNVIIHAYSLDGQVGSFEFVVDRLSAEVKVADHVITTESAEDVQKIVDTIEHMYVDNKGTTNDLTDDEHVFVVEESNLLLKGVREDKIKPGQTIFLEANELFFTGFSGIFIDKKPSNSVEFPDKEYELLYFKETSITSIFADDVRLDFSEINKKDPIAFSYFPDGVNLEINEEGKEDSARLSDMQADMSEDGKEFSKNSQQFSASVVPKSNKRLLYAGTSQQSNVQKKPGFQWGQIFSSFEAKTEFDEGKPNKPFSISLGMKATPWFDHDGDLTTQKDQIRVSGGFKIDNIDIQAGIETHQGGLNHTSVKQIIFKSSFNIEKNIQVDFGKELKVTAEQFAPPGMTIDSKPLQLLSNTIALSGVDLTQNAFPFGVLAINLSTGTPVYVPRVQTVQGTSRTIGLAPILIIALVIDFSGEVKAQASIAYKSVSSHVTGFNIQHKDYNGKYGSVSDQRKTTHVVEESSHLGNASIRYQKFRHTEDKGSELNLKLDGEAGLAFGGGAFIGLMIGGIVPAVVSAKVMVSPKMKGNVAAVLKFKPGTEDTLPVIEGDYNFELDFNIQFITEVASKLIVDLAFFTLPGIDYKFKYSYPIFRWKRNIAKEHAVLFRVLDNKKQPVSGVKISCEFNGKWCEGDHKTDKNGYVEIKLSSGMYTVYLTKDGYKDGEYKEVEIPSKKDKIELELKPQNPISVLTQTDLEMTVPIAGAPMYVNFTPPSQYASATVAWSPHTPVSIGAPPNTFLPNTSYTATVTLTPASGYTAQGLEANVYKVAGAQQVFNEKNSAVVTVTYAPTATVANMVQVGVPGVTYPVPVGIVTEEIKDTKGGFWIGRTEVTYAEWHAVRMWAENNGYVFANRGREGYDGAEGAEPTSAKLKPVITVSWRDIVVWSNAKSEKEGLSPVYRSKDNVVLRDAKKETVDHAVKLPGTNGYRLPTHDEWEMAARWLGAIEPTRGSLAKERKTTMANGVMHYWTPSNYASGAIENSSNKEECNKVAWYSGNTIVDAGPHAVGEKYANALGLVDVSGNVSEITEHSSKVEVYSIRGGEWVVECQGIEVSSKKLVIHNHEEHYGTGFRLARDTVEASLTVTQTDLEMTVPVTGAPMYDKFTPPFQYASATVAWSPIIPVSGGAPPNTFLSNITYTATVTLTPASGYTAQGLEANVYKVAGAQQVFNEKNSAVVTVTYAPTANIEEDIEEMVQVGTPGVTYSVPIGYWETPTDVAGGFWMGRTEVTYAEWYAVRMWAESNGYVFTNLGREGHDGVYGAAPTSASQEPVTGVSWYDVVVWSNAKSERAGLTPVYRESGSTAVLRNANHVGDDPTPLPNANGYRLPSNHEWEMAARWLGTSATLPGGIGAVESPVTTTVGGVTYYWTPGNYASGAKNATVDEFSRIGWWYRNSGLGTRTVGLKDSNMLGMRDVSGNVWEWTFDLINFWNYWTWGPGRGVWGGSWNDVDTVLPVSFVYQSAPTRTDGSVGFRLSRTVL